MSHGPRAFGLPPTPELATDAEISGLFRLIESDAPLPDWCFDEGPRCAHGFPITSDDEHGTCPECAAAATGLPLAGDAVALAFRGLARAVAAVLNR